MWLALPLVAPRVPDRGVPAQDKAPAEQSAASGRVGRLSLAQGQVMTPDILCPEMTPSFRKEWFLGQTRTGDSVSGAREAAHTCPSAPAA